MKAILDFPGYFADELGRIYSSKPRNRNSIPPTKPRLLKSGNDGRGYLYVILRRNGKSFARRVHRLILETFVGLCPESMEACHNNGIRTDNRLENLRWDTKKNNQADSKKHGTRVDNRGEKCGSHKLAEADVIMIRRYATIGASQKSTAATFQVSPSAISLIVNRRNWKHI